MYLVTVPRPDGADGMPGIIIPRKCIAELRKQKKPRGRAAKSLPNFPDMATKLKPGDTMRAPGFLRLHPKAAASAA